MPKKALRSCGSTAGAVYRSANGGVLWTSAIGGAGSKTITDVIALPSPSQEVIVANEQGGLYRSTDNGTTFRSEKTIGGITSGSTGSITNIALDAAYTASGAAARKYLYETNSGVPGVYRLLQGDVQWTQIDTGLQTQNALACTGGTNGSLYGMQGLASAPSSALYGANFNSNVWLRRSVDSYSLDPIPTWANITQLNPDTTSPGALPNNPTIRTVKVSGRDLFVINAADNDAGTSSGTPITAMAIWTFTDNLTSPLTQNLPADKANLTGNMVTMTWTRPTGPAGSMTYPGITYEVELATDATMRNPESRIPLANVGTLPAPTTATLAILGTPGTYVTPSTSGLITGLTISPGMTYYWHVRAMGPGHEPSPWSTIRSYVTALPSPTLVGPMGGQLTGGIGATLRPVIQWQAVAGANRYELQVDTSASFFSPFVNLTDTNRLDTTSYQIDKALDYSTTYYWRVRAASFTALSDWSTVGSFTTIDKPVPPTPPITITQVPAPQINIPAATTPSWVWVVIVIGAILVIVMLVLIVRTRRV